MNQLQPPLLLYCHHLFLVDTLAFDLILHAGKEHEDRAIELSLVSMGGHWTDDYWAKGGWNNTEWKLGERISWEMVIDLTVKKFEDGMGVN